MHLKRKYKYQFNKPYFYENYWKFKSKNHPKERHNLSEH
jgi:hypothetical protein